ncbi:hypothetical protein AURANDRAFT_68536 [Aureococcus anophagefferens]|uniref:ABC transporter n=1 Tax=Aureococcus anophagefferens TaxID=44056 RepID=F0YPZ0_AURAN|nr:hypothetical protein AURANDRAFT_68536 [Aureococcus anophagefferens]EGB02819.1 hypothetical protein AURANDRAFT_68536 [Aureococcus anophagefferens]|eukprot:XP_009042481.1 hypothetical protein AURANDRAFT_68536 [Aureococcus anophagefferens]
MERRRRLLLALVAVANAIEAPRSVAGAAQLRGARDVPGATTESETDYAAAAETDGAAAGPARAAAPPAPRATLGEVFAHTRGFVAATPSQQLLFALTFAFLVAQKALNVRVPFALQRAVDALGDGGDGSAAASRAVASYCLGRLGVSAAGELRSLCFSRVSQRCQRAFGAAVFGKAHAMDARWHANHPTGEVAVAFGRGTRGVASLLFLGVFSVVPTVLELVFSVGVLRRRFGSHGFGLVTLATFAAYAAWTASLLAQPMNFLGYTVSEIRQGLVDADAVVKLLRDAPAAADDAPPHAVPSPPEIAFSGVSASRDGFTLALKNATFTAPAGGVTLLVGASGSGKSTALRLVNGLDAAPTAGAVTVGGLALSAADARRATALVAQDTALFDDTVLYNAKYGNVLAPLDAAVAALAAAGAAHLDPRQRVGERRRERGAKLSGGEKQRVLAARALLRDAPVLLADEPTSALDAVSEARVLDALLGSGRTAVVVAHRLAAVAPRADNIAVFRDGTVVAEGKHDALLASCAEYARLWEAKSGSSEEGE